MTKRRNFILAADTGVVSLINAGVLIVGARRLDLDGVTQLTLLQFYAVLSVGLQRATLLNPALATRSEVGAGVVIPVKWIFVLTIPTGFILGTAAQAGLIGSGVDAVELTVAVIASIILVLVQDISRFMLFSRDLTLAALASDLVWLAVSAPLILTAPSSTWIRLTEYWALGAAAGIAVAATSLWASPTPERSSASLKSTLRLGKWSGTDAAISGVAGLLPMLVSTFGAAASPVAAYRIMQTALGPLNILSATLLTAFGLDAAKYADVTEAKHAPARAKRLSWQFALGAFVILTWTLPLMLYVSDVRITEHMRPFIITLFAGVLGAATIPFSSVTSAMGGQRYGFYIRVSVLAMAIVLSYAGSQVDVPPFNDPIGNVAVVSSVAALIGWSMASQRVSRRRVHDASARLQRGR